MVKEPSAEESWGIVQYEQKAAKNNDRATNGTLLCV